MTISGLLLSWFFGLEIRLLLSWWTWGWQTYCCLLRKLYYPLLYVPSQTSLTVMLPWSFCGNATVCSRKWRSHLCHKFRTGGTSPFAGWEVVMRAIRYHHVSVSNTLDFFYTLVNLHNIVFSNENSILFCGFGFSEFLMGLSRWVNVKSCLPGVDITQPSLGVEETWAILLHHSILNLTCVWCLSLLVPVWQVDEYAWQELTLLKAVLLETQAKLLMKGGQFDRGEEVCRTCLKIRSVMLGPDHVDTIAAQETLAKLVRYRNTM